MGHVSTGIRRILEHPFVYEALQTAVGHKVARRMVIDEYVNPEKNAMILDIGCGPGKMLEILSDVEYVGVDFNESYIKSARELYVGKGNFLVGNATSIDLPEDEQFDIILAYNLMHHMEDVEVSELLDSSKKFLKKGGKLISMDPCLVSDATLFARMLIKFDRGTSIRTAEGYSNLAINRFEKIESHVRYDLLNFTYPHCILSCIK